MAGRYGCFCREGGVGMAVFVGKKGLGFFAVARATLNYLRIQTFRNIHKSRIVIRRKIPKSPHNTSIFKSRIVPIEETVNLYVTNYLQIPRSALKEKILQNPYVTKHP